MAAPDTVDAFLDTLGAEERAMAVALRRLALGAREDVTEHIKWNAPSFCVDGDDRITLGVERKGGIRAVLHRGAKVKNASDFTFDDPAALAKWPSVDRGVMVFARVADIEARALEIADIFKRWLDATT